MVFHRLCTVDEALKRRRKGGALVSYPSTESNGTLVKTAMQLVLQSPIKSGPIPGNIHTYIPVLAPMARSILV